MGIIICQQCAEVINYYDDEKVTKLYSICPNCNKKKEKTN